MKTSMLATYRRLLGFVRPMRRFAVPYFFYALFYALFNTLSYLMILPIMDSLFGTDGAYAFTPVREFPPVSELGIKNIAPLLNYIYTHLFGEQFSMMRMLALLGGLVVLVNLLGNLFRYLSAMTVESMRARSLQNMREAMFARMMTLQPAYFSDQRKGDLMSRITQDAMVVQYSITNTLQVVFRDPLLVIGYVVAMLAISWRLSLFVVVFLPLVALIVGSIVKRLRHPAMKGQERMGDLSSVLDESISGIKVIKSYNAEGYVRRKFTAFNAELSRLMISMARRQQAASPVSEFLGLSAIAVVLVYGGSLVMGGSLSAGDFLGFLAMFSQITRPVRSFIDQFANLNQGIAAGERIFEVIDQQPEIADAPDAVGVDGLKTDVEFRDVHFSYDGRREVVDGVSFRVPRGATVALVGPSGGGKTTLSELLPRFYDPTAGEILWDGVSLKAIKQESLRAHLSVVSQDTVLFNDTIEANIAMGRPGATHEQIVEAARVANAHDFIMECPEGYQTNIGDRGAKLSGGQRQRLSIARAVLKNPDLLILDEATSALDTESEKLVQEALSALLEGRTSVVIAHRLSTIHNADKILVVDRGRVVEQGTHTELMAQKGIYARLIEMQSFE